MKINGGTIARAVLQAFSSTTTIKGDNAYYEFT